MEVSPQANGHFTDAHRAERKIARWASIVIRSLRAVRWTALVAPGKRGSVAWTNAEAEPRAINANARPIIVAAIIVAIPRRRVVSVPADHATAPCIPALAGVVTDQPCLVK